MTLGELITAIEEQVGQGIMHLEVLHREVVVRVKSEDYHDVRVVFDHETGTFYVLGE